MFETGQCTQSVLEAHVLGYGGGTDWNVDPTGMQQELHQQNGEPTRSIIDGADVVNYYLAAMEATHRLVY